MFVIAGATGHVGGAAARQLLERGAQIRVIVREGAKGQPWAAAGAEVAVGNLGDDGFLASAMADSAGFFTLLPLDVATTDPYGDQRRLGEAIASAVDRSGVPHVVLLSSHGAELTEGTGLVRSLHHLETALGGTGTQLTTVRSGYHQENVAALLGPAQAHGIVPSFLAADTPTRMVATVDLGEVVADRLLAPAGHSEVVDVQGPWYTMREVTQRLSAALGRPLEVAEIPELGWVDAFVQAGMSPPLADAFAEMYRALAAGRLVPLGDRIVDATAPIDEVIAALVPALR